MQCIEYLYGLIGKKYGDCTQLEEKWDVNCVAVAMRGNGKEEKEERDRESVWGVHKESMQQ